MPKTINLLLNSHLLEGKEGRGLRPGETWFGGVRLKLKEG